MPIDRAKRDVATEALAAFLRHETGFEALETVIIRLNNEIEKERIESSKQDLIFADMLFAWFEYGHRNQPMTQERWLEMCRHLAFLRTDLDVSSWQGLSTQEYRSYDTHLARCHALGLLVFTGFAYLTHWWILVAAMIVSFTHFHILSQRNQRALREAENTQMSRWIAYCPFKNEAEWLAHRHLLDEYQIPSFDADAFGEPLPNTKWPAIISIPYVCIAYLFVYGAITCALLWMLCLWPLTLAMMAFDKTKRSPDACVEL